MHATTGEGNVFTTGYHGGYALYLNHNCSRQHTDHPDNIKSLTVSKYIKYNRTLNMTANTVIWNNKIQPNGHYWNNTKCFTSTAGETVFWLQEDGTVYGNGTNEHYELGIEDKKHIHNPTLIPTLTHIQNVCSGFGFSVALTANGDVLTTSNFKHYRKWRPKESLKQMKIEQISCGGKHMLCLDRNGIIRSCGDNRFGQLGTGGLNNNTRSVSIVVFKPRIRISKIDCGCAHNLALDEDGNVWSWGRNDVYQCGETAMDKISTPHMIQSLHARQIIDIKCGYNHSYVMSKDKEHFLFGSNSYNECSLVLSKKNTVKKPFCINEIVTQETKGKMISEVFLGNGSTIIVVDVKVDKNDDVEEKQCMMDTSFGSRTMCTEVHNASIEGKYERLQEEYTATHENLITLQRLYNRLNITHKRTENVQSEQEELLNDLREENDNVMGMLKYLQNENEELEKECTSKKQMMKLKMDDMEEKYRILEEKCNQTQGVCDVPDEFICCITLELMNDPVICVDGHTYERSAIEEWLNTNHASPKTNALLKSNTLIPNRALKNLIDDWRSKN